MPDQRVHDLCELLSVPYTGKRATNLFVYERKSLFLISPSGCRLFATS